MSNIKIGKIKKEKVRLGRGKSSGHGKTAGRGMSGQKSRTGASTSFFEGGQTKFSSRVPKKKGFSKKSRGQVYAITLDRIVKLYKEGETVDFNSLIEKLKLPRSKMSGYSALKIIKGRGQNKIPAVKINDSVKLTRGAESKLQPKSDGQDNRPD